MAACGLIINSRKSNRMVYLFKNADGLDVVDPSVYDPSVGIDPSVDITGYDTPEGGYVDSAGNYYSPDQVDAGITSATSPYTPADTISTGSALQSIGAAPSSLSGGPANLQSSITPSASSVNATNLPSAVVGNAVSGTAAALKPTSSSSTGGSLLDSIASIFKTATSPASASKTATAGKVVAKPGTAAASTSSSMLMPILIGAGVITVVAVVVFAIKKGKK